jgi:hypothetical protein
VPKFGLEFNRSSNAVDECFSEGQQDTDAENRPTSLMSPGNMATLEFGTLNPKITPPDTPTTDPPTDGKSCNSIEPGKIPHQVCFGRQNITFTKDSLDYGKHQSMTLITGRNDNGLYEPKVTSGLGYTITASDGITDVVHVGLTDAVKPDIIAPTSATDPGENPFFVRVGICYTSMGGKHPNDAAGFTINRGYRSWGGQGVNFNDADLKKYFVHLEEDFSYLLQHCKDKDSDNKSNLYGPDTANGCPAAGVTAVPSAGNCPYPSCQATAGRGGNAFSACIYGDPKGSTQSAACPNGLEKASTLQQVNTIDALLTNALPDPTKYFYDPATGWLFFYVMQEFPNPIAGSPLGSCSADGLSASDDKSCPDVVQHESFYACPAQGCIVSPQKSVAESPSVAGCHEGGKRAY